ncbi:MAG: hypothetical protein WC878_05730 [Candidatus Paceibacterota bacterium]|jgi:hypothetical protein
MAILNLRAITTLTAKAKGSPKRTGLNLRSAKDSVIEKYSD